MGMVGYNMSKKKKKEWESQNLLPRSLPPSSPFISHTFKSITFGKLLECRPNMDNIKRDVSPRRRENDCVNFARTNVIRKKNEEKENV